MTSDESPLREKLGTPEGESEILKVSSDYDEQQDIERKNDNSPLISKTQLNDNTIYEVNSKKRAVKSGETK